jgi:hypothetical protein
MAGSREAYDLKVSNFVCTPKGQVAVALVTHATRIFLKPIRESRIKNHPRHNLGSPALNNCGQKYIDRSGKGVTLTYGNPRNPVVTIKLVYARFILDHVFHWGLQIRSSSRWQSSCRNRAASVARWELNHRCYAGRRFLLTDGG